MRKTLRQRTVMAAAVGTWLAYLLINLGGIYLTGAHAWDDGAITLAYARTLGEHGVFALTPVSDVVEGSSSLLLVFIMALLHRLLHFDFDRFILASQLLTFVATTALLITLHRALRRSLEGSLERALIVGLFGTLPMFTAEIANGMEMSLFALLMVWMVMAIQSESVLAFLLIPLVLLTRFESIFYLAFSLALLLVVQAGSRRTWARLLACVVLTFIGITAFRWLFFGALVPNSILAKMNPPYSGGGLLDTLLQKWAGASEFIGVSLFLLLASFGSLFLRGRGEGRMDLKVALVVSFAIFAVVAGKNWGYEGRMFLACLPLMLMIAGDTFAAEPVRSARFRLSFGQWDARSSGRELLVGILLCALVATHVATFEVFATNVKTAGYGGYVQKRMPERMRKFVADHPPRLDEPYGWVTPANFRVTGVAIEKMRGLLGLESIRFMVPDVGGVGLCCARIEVLDLALLTNKALARTGYRGFDAYLERAVPDVIETHGYWTEFSGIYGSRFFNTHYVPVVFENTLFWVHATRAAALVASSKIERSWISDLDSLAHVRYGSYAVDQRHLRRRSAGGVWAVSVK